MKAILGLGTNIGNRAKNLAEAIAMLDKIGKIEKASKLYETKPWRVTNQDDFLNQALIINYDKSPSILLSETQSIEKTLGRTKTRKWGPRLIDIDILFIGQKIIRSSQLQIPHPRITKRNFVLVPLNEIAPHFRHPIYKKNISELLSLCPDPTDVRLYHKSEKL